MPRPIDLKDSQHTANSHLPLMLLVRVVAIACVMFIAFPTESPAQQVGALSPKQLSQKAERLQALVYRQPKRGNTFDLWYQHHADAGDLATLLDDAEKRAEAQKDECEPHVVLGLLYERMGRIGDALNAYEASTKLDKGYYSHFLLGTLRLRQKEFEAAKLALEKAFEFNLPKQDYISVSKPLAETYNRLGDREQAQATWKKTAERFVDDARVLSEIASLLGRERQYDQAIKLWQRVRELSNDDIFQKLDADIQIAQLHEDLGEKDLAIKLMGELLDRVAPESWRAEDICKRLERAVLEKSGPDGLAAFWKNRVASHPDDLLTLTRLAKAYEYTDQSNEAITLYYQAVERAPNRRDVRELLIAYLKRQGEFSQAVEHAQQITRSNKTDVAAWKQLADLYLKLPDVESTERHQKAVDAFSQIATIRSQDPTYAIEAANALTSAIRQSASSAIMAPSEDANGEPTKLSPSIRKHNALLVDAAEIYFLEAVRRAPEATQYREYLGEFFHWTDRPKKAIETWAQIAKLDTADRWHQFSRIAARFGYLDEAISAGRKSIERDQGNLTYRKDQVALLAKQEEFARAIAEAKVLLEKSTDERWEETAVRLLADLIARLGDDSEANQLVENISDPKDYRSLWVLALFSEEATAVSYMQRAVAIQPSRISLNKSYADLLVNAGRVSDAISQYRRLVSLSPDRRRQFYQRIVELEMRERDFVAAMATVELLVQVAPSDPESYTLKALVAKNAGKGEEEVEALRKAVQLSSEDVSIRRQLMAALESTGRIPDAKHEAYLCLEMADQLADKESIVSWLLRHSTTRVEKDELIARIEQIRQRADDPHNMTMCLVQVFKHFGRKVDALIQLELAHQQHPNNTSLLSQVVAAADASNKPSVAVEYQQRLIAIDDSPKQKELLARLYRIDNRLEDANRIWDELFNRDLTELQIREMIDRQIRAEDFFQAQRLVEVGLSRNPQDWRLAYQAGMLHIAMGQPSHAVQAFELLLSNQGDGTNKIGKASSPQLMIGMPKEFEELIGVFNAWQQFENLSRYLIPGRNRFRGLKKSLIGKLLFSPPYKLSGNGDNLATARIYGVVALFRCLSDDVSSKWVKEILTTNTNVSDARLAMLAAWTSARTDDFRQLVARVIELDDKEPIPHILRILAAGEGDVLPDIGRLADSLGVDLNTVEESADAIDESSDANDRLRTSYRWLREHNGDAANALRDIYLNYLANVGSRKPIDKQRVYETVAEELEHVRVFSELTGLVYVLISTGLDTPSELHTNLVKKAHVVLMNSTMKDVFESDLKSVVEFASSNLATDEDVGRLIDFLDKYLHQSNFGSAPQRPNTQYADTLMRLMQRQRALAQSQILFHRIQSKSGISSRQSAINQALIRRINAANQGFMVSTQLGAVRVLRPGPGVSMTVNSLQVRSATNQSARQGNATTTQQALRSGAFGFPCSTSFFDLNRLRVLEQVIVELKAINKLSALSDLLDNRSSETDNPDRAAFELARAYVAWWRDQPDETLKIVRQLVADYPTHSSAMVALVRCCLETKNLREALIVLNQIVLDSHNASELTLLRSTIAHHWSRFAAVHEFAGHDGAAASIAFSPDGKRLLSGGTDKKVYLWDVTTGEKLAQFDGHHDMIMSVAFAPDGKHIATGGYDSVIRLLDENLQEQETLEGHPSTVRCLAFSPAGDLLASADDDGTILLWDMHEMKLKGKLVGHTNSAMSLSFSRDGKTLASGSADQSVVIWTVQTGKSRQVLDVNAGPVSALGFYNQSDNLVTGSEGRQLAFWEQSELTETNWKRTNHVPDSGVRCLAISPHDEFLALGFDDRSVKIWDLRGQVEQAILQGHQGRINSVAFDPTGKFLASAANDGSINLWLANPLQEQSQRSNANSSKILDGKANLGALKFD